MSQPTLDQLYALFGASYDQNPNVRKAAELDLRALERQANVLPAAFHIVTNNDADLGHRQAAAIWVKNRVRRGWDVSATSAAPLPPSAAGGTGAPIADADKALLREALLPALATLPPRLRVHAMSTLYHTVPDNFVQEWPQLLPSIVETLNSNNPVLVGAGARALLVLCRRQRWNSDEGVMESISVQTFPQLLQLARSLLDAPDAASNADVGDLLHIIIKTYLRAISQALAPHLQSTIASWGAVFLATISKEINEASLPEDAEEKAQTPWWKAKKWAYRVLSKLYRRYGNPSQLLSNMKQYKPFATTFFEQFAPEILRAYLQQTELVVAGRYISPIAKIQIFEFYHDCILAKGLWSRIKPHIQTIVQSFAFPTLCMDAEEIEKFEDEPIVFIREQMDPTEEYGTPAGIAFDFVRTAVSKRKSATFHPILAFLQEVMTAAGAGQRSPVEKEGALRLSGAMCVTMVNDDAIGSQLDSFMSTQVLTELANTAQPLLQFRACQVIKNFDNAGMHWTNTATLEAAFQGVLTCLMEPTMALPVRLQAAEALGVLIGHEDVHTACAANAGRLMQELLALSDKTDLDVLLRTQEKVVDNFATELLPFAVELATQLRNSFIRLVGEMTAAAQAVEESGDLSSIAAATPETENHMFAAMASLSTMYQLVSAADNNKTILAQLEATLLPGLIYALENKRSEFTDDVYDVIEVLTFNQQQISPEMWRVFELSSEILLDWGTDYITEIQSSLANFIAYGADVIAGNPAYKKALIEVYLSQWHRDADDTELIEACKLADSMLLRMPAGTWDAELPSLLEPVVPRVLAPTADSPALRRWTDIVLLDSFIYNAPLAVTLLSSQHLLASALQAIIPRAPTKFARIHECRVGVFAFLALLSLPAATMPAEVQAAAPTLLADIVALLAKYPEVASRKQELAELLDDESLDGLLDGDEDGGAGLVEDVADDKDVDNESNELYEMLLAAAEKRRQREDRRAAIAAGEAPAPLDGEDDSDDEEDLDDDDAIYESALSKLRMYDAFRQWRDNFAAATPAALDALLAQLPADTKGALATVSEMKDDDLAALDGDTA